MILELFQTELYTQRDVTVQVGWSNVIGILVAVPILGVFSIPYSLLWQKSLIVELSHVIRNSASMSGLAILGFLLVSGIVGHEMIHGITWSRHCEQGFRSIKFGVAWKFLTPYCHCSELLPVKHYRIGIMAPGVLLGFVPALVGIFTSSFAWLAYGIFFSLAAGGDFLMMWLLRRENPDNLVLDHPTKVGCLIYEKKA